MKHETIEAVLTEMARLQGRELNGQDTFELRTRVAACLSAKERHFQRMNVRLFRWNKPKPPRSVI